MLWTGDRLRNGPHVGTVATPSAVSGVPNALHRVTKSEMAHKWAWWLPNPWRLGGPNALDGGQNQKWPTSGHSGYVTRAVSGVLNAFNEGQNQNWPTCGHSGYLTPAVSGVPLAFNGGQNQKWPKSGHSGCLTPAVSGVPNALPGDKIRNGPHVITVASKPLPCRGSPMLWTGT